jgi:hypothetical protein
MDLPDDELPPEEIARRMERNIRRFLKMPPQAHGKNPRASPRIKQKERAATKGRVHQG